MRRLQRPKPSFARVSKPRSWVPRVNSSRTLPPTMPNSQAPSLTKVGMSSSRTNIKSAAKFSMRAVSSFLPFWMRRPASRSRPRLNSDRRPDFWMAMWRRSRSTSIGGSVGRIGEGVDGAAVAVMGLLAQEAGDADDGGGADAGRLVDVAVGEVGAVEQAGDVPALGEGTDFLRCAQVGEELGHLRLGGRGAEC